MGKDNLDVVGFNQVLKQVLTLVFPKKKIKMKINFSGTTKKCYNKNLN